MTICPALG